MRILTDGRLLSPLYQTCRWKGRNEQLAKVFPSLQMFWHSANIAWVCVCVCTGQCYNPPIPGRNWWHQFWNGGWMGICAFGWSPRCSVILYRFRYAGKEHITCWWPQISMTGKGNSCSSVMLVVVLQKIWHSSMPLEQALILCQIFLHISLRKLCCVVFLEIFLFVYSSDCYLSG